MLCFLICNDEFDFYYCRIRKVEELRFAQDVVPSKSRHGAKCRAAANAKPIRAHKQPFPHDPMVVALTFMQRWPSATPEAGTSR